MRIVVNMVVTIAAALNFLSSLSSLIGQPSLGCLRLIFSVFFTYVVTRCDAIADSGRLGFICRPETNEFHREQCFSRYSAEMSPLMRPYLFLLVTACMLVCLWTTMIVYSLRHLPKIRRETFSSKKEHLCHEFWKKFLLHVSSEAVVLSVILGLFCYTQKIYFPETYNCTLGNALVTCTYLHQWDKSLLNIVLIGVMLLMLLFCIVTFYQAMCNRENFIKELLTLNTTENEADDDGYHHSNTSRNNANNDGANHHRSTQFSGFTNTGNSNEQQGNMGANAVMKYLLPFCTLESQSIAGKVRFGLTIFTFIVLVNFDTGSGRLGFACSSEADAGITPHCFSKYSAAMSSFLHPNTFVWMTAGTLFVLWSFIILYGSKHSEKIRRKLDLSEKKQLCHEFWKKSLLHVCFESVVIVLILMFFYCTQEITLPEIYSCTVGNAAKEIVQTCEDVHHWSKSKLNCAYVFVMASLLVLCIATIFDTIYNKECFIKDLVDLNTKENEAVYAGSSFDTTSRNLTETTPSEWATANSSVSPSLSNSIRHRKVGGDSDDSEIE